MSALAEEVPTALRGLPQVEVSLRLDVALACANRYRIRTARDLRSFLRMCFLIAPDFADSAPFSQLLREHEGRVQPLFDHVPVDTWQRAMIESIVRQYPRILARVPVQSSGARTAIDAAIVPLSLAHEQAWWHHRLHPDVWRLGAALPLLTLDDARTHMRDLLMARCEHFAIVGRDREFIGALLLSPRGDGAMLSYWVRRDLWGMGFASHAIRTLVQQTSTEGKYAHLEATVHTSNTLSAYVLQKAGFEIRANSAVMQFEPISHPPKAVEHG